MASRGDEELVALFETDSREEFDSLLTNHHLDPEVGLISLVRAMAACDMGEDMSHFNYYARKLLDTRQIGTEQLQSTLNSCAEMCFLDLARLLIEFGAVVDDTIRATVLECGWADEMSSVISQPVNSDDSPKAASGQKD